MLTCKQVAKSLADRDYAELTPLKRLGLRAHVLLCFVCGRYHRQLMRFQDAVRRYRHSEPAPRDEGFRLGGNEREAIRKALAEESAPPESDAAER